MLLFQKLGVGLDVEIGQRIVDYDDEKKQILDAVKELRNAVNHHKFLKLYKFKDCNVDGSDSDSLIANIQNLRQLLPLQYRFGENGRGGITKELALIGITIS